jgi:stage II sporulation protein AA (anti-sigma F factor antagonist)
MVSEQRLAPNTVILSPGRSLDNSNAHEIAEAICEAQARGMKNIILDMRELEFLSSAGVGAILGTIGKSRDMGGDIVLWSPGERILHVLEVLDLRDYLTIRYDDRMEEDYGVEEDGR